MSKEKGLLVAHVRREQVRDAVFDRIALGALRTDQPSGDYLVTVLYVDVKLQLRLIERTADDLHQRLLHADSPTGLMARATDAGEKSVTGSRGFLGRACEATGMREAVVIAGGRSTRFGERDKAVAPLAGVPMIRRVADRVGGVTDRLVVNCREDQREAIAGAMEGYENPLAYAIDPETDAGPMAGIRTGLAAVEAEYAAVVACDMPFVDRGFLEYLFGRAAGHDAAVPRREDGWYQTTQAVFRAAAMVEACDRALAAGDRKVIAPLFDLEYVVVTEDEIATHASAETFENVNTEAELRAAADRLTEQ